MLFYEPPFLLFFLTVFAVLLLARGNVARSWIVLIASLLFYLWGEPLFVPVLIASAGIDYILSVGMNRQSEQSARRWMLATGVIANLAMLIVYKYADFVVDNVNMIASVFRAPQLPLLHIVLPIGISFVVFEKITYLADIFRGQSKPSARFSDYCLFVLFFPKLLAGPILQFHDMREQIETPRPIVWHDVQAGFVRFAFGMARKVLIADPVGSFANDVFAADPNTLGPSTAWVGLACFTVQIYFDFAGYSDMAIGLARIVGFRLNENFNAPYTAHSITDFWRRWHMSLTSWIRDYLYIPLGGDRLGMLRTSFNLWTCFLLSGLWHGAGWNFILWGAYNGMFLTLDRLFLRKALAQIPGMCSNAVTLLIVMIGWAIFRSASYEQLISILSALCGLAPEKVALEVPAEVVFTLAVGTFLSLLPTARVQAALNGARRTLTWGGSSLITITGGVVFAIALARAMAVPFQPFIYFRF